MSFFDTTLLVIIAVFVLNGLVKGLIRSVGSLAALLAGIWCAVYFHSYVYLFLKNLFFGRELLGTVVSFLIVYAIANSLINFLFTALNNAYDVISIIPFLKAVNRLGGAVFGLMEGGLILGFIFYYGLKFPPSALLIQRWSAKSEIFPFLVAYAEYFIPMVPGIIDWIKGLVSPKSTENLTDVI